MLTLADFAAAKGFTVEQLAAFGVRQNGRGLEIPYFDTDGREYPRIRIRTAIAAKDGSEWSRGKSEIIPYGAHRPISWEKRFAFVVEGESDCWALWSVGLPAIGIPGATNMKCIRLELFDGADTLYVIREPGEAGSDFPHRVAQKLYDLGFAGDVYAISLGTAKDPHELWQRDPSAFIAQMRTIVAERQLVPRPVKAKPHTGMRSLREILASPRKKTEWLIDDMLPMGGIMLLAGKPKAGKSVLARNIARAVAMGGEFLGRQCRQGKVVWLRLEEQYEAFLDDIEAMGAAEWADNLITNEDIPKGDLFVWLDAIVKENDPALVVIDTWAKLTRVKDIINYSEVNRANEPLMRLREAGVAQIWMHHAKKGEASGDDDVLGSQALFAACDTLAFYRRNKTDDARTFSTTQRVGEDTEETIVDLDPRTKLVRRNLARADARLELVQSEILLFLGSQSNCSATKTELTTEIKRRRADILAACDILENRRLVRVHRSGYMLPETVSLIVGGLAKNGAPSAIRFGTVDEVDPNLRLLDTDKNSIVERGSGLVPDQFRAFYEFPDSRSSGKIPHQFQAVPETPELGQAAPRGTVKSESSDKFRQFPIIRICIARKSGLRLCTAHRSHPMWSDLRYTVASSRQSYIVPLSYGRKDRRHDTRVTTVASTGVGLRPACGHERSEFVLRQFLVPVPGTDIVIRMTPVWHTYGADVWGTREGLTCGAHVWGTRVAAAAAVRP